MPSRVPLRVKFEPERLNFLLVSSSWEFPSCVCLLVTLHNNFVFQLILNKKLSFIEETNKFFTYITARYIEVARVHSFS